MSAADGTSVSRTHRELEGLGCKRKRVEDARFTQGKGKYVDDMKLPGMRVRRFRPLAPRPCQDQERSTSPRRWRFPA